jgi:hypothetical protein
VFRFLDPAQFEAAAHAANRRTACWSAATVARVAAISSRYSFAFCGIWKV